MTAAQRRWIRHERRIAGVAKVDFHFADTCAHLTPHTLSRKKHRAEAMRERSRK